MTSAASHDASPFGLIAARVTKTQLGRRTRMLLERGDSPRSGEKVWRNSYTEGTIEHRIWKPINDGTTRGGKRWTAALLKAARQLEYRTRRERREKEPGARNGALGEVGLEVLAYLYETVDYTTGRLEPAIATIADAIGRSYAAVHEALCRLREKRFVSWIRRSKPVPDPQPGGQQVEQVSNAYGLLVPEAMKDWLSTLLRPTRAQCEIDRRKRQDEEYQAMLAGLTAEEFHEATWDGCDRLLGERIASLGKAIDARDKKKGESSTMRETGGSY